MYVSDDNAGGTAPSGSHPPTPRPDLAERRAQQAALLADLAALGLPVVRVSDLYNLRLDYRAAIPLLMEWLPRLQDPSLRREVMGALGSKWGKPVAAPLLLAEFEREGPIAEALRWHAGDALSFVATPAILDDLIRLATDRRYGHARQMLCYALGNTGDKRAIPVLIDLLNDPDVAGHAIVGLRKLRAVEAEDSVRPFVDHPTAWIRNEAKKALAAFAKERARRAG